VKLGPPGSQELVMIMNSTEQWSGHIDRIYWAVSPVTLTGVVEQVRTALTVLVSEINANVPDGTATPPAEVANHAVQVAVSGKRNMINVVAALGESTVAAPSSEEEHPRRWLRIAGAVLLGLVAIVAMIFTLMQVQGWRLG
jgi:capsular polysaccharide biosynthesis protein